MKVLVIGLGSMGRRRIRLVKRYDASIEIMGIDMNPERCAQAQQELGIETGNDLAQALASGMYEAALISTSPASHASIIRQCLENNVPVFTELNLLSNGYAENQKLAAEKNLTLFLSSTFLYRKEVAWIREQIARTDKPLTYQYHVGQYLPDWHPWEDYRNFFVGKKETNGCRELLAIELPWLCNLFGDLTSVQCVKKQLTGLDIDYPDAYLMILNHADGHSGILQIDVAARKAVRSFELTGEDICLTWNGKPDGLVSYDIENKCDCPVSLYEQVDRLDGYAANIIENAYFDEVREFFETCKGNTKPRYSFAADEKILNWIDRIEAE